MLIGPLQNRAMNILWNSGPATVHTIRNALNGQPGAQQLAYTTILTIMRNLAKRGFVSIQPEGRSYRFIPTVTRSDYQSAATNEFVSGVFGGNGKAASEAVLSAHTIDAGALERKLKPVALGRKHVEAVTATAAG